MAARSCCPSLLLGVATGLLWAPCAGPVLGLILTGAALEGASVGTTLLLLAYAAGAATSLALALLVGGRVFTAMKRSLGAGEWIRRGLGVAVLVAVAAIALGLDTGFLTRFARQHHSARAAPGRQAQAGPDRRRDGGGPSVVMTGAGDAMTGGPDDGGDEPAATAEPAMMGKPPAAADAAGRRRRCRRSPARSHGSTRRR